VPTLVALRALRLAGCALPAEVWFPQAEAPTRGLEGLLAGLGAVARLLPGAARTTEGALGAKAAGAAAAAAEGKGEKQRRGEKDGAEGEEEGDPASAGASAGASDPASDAAAPLGPSLGPAGGDGDLSGFTMKAAALLLSRFAEVLFLDSDNVAALDPESLFESREFKGSGAVLWPDYWESTAARDASAALGLEDEDEEGEEGEKESSKNLLLSRGSHESGQMLFDKARAWRALSLAAYFNSAPGFYYEILSCFMGKGDKETFAAALAATRTPFHRMETPVGSVGLRAVPERRCWLGQRWCSSGRYAGNTMTQHDT
jgi:alpha 1,2-mannosyltransferase